MTVRMELSEMLKNLIAELKRIVTTETVIGEPMTVEDKILIPVIKVFVGLGAGTGGAKKPGEVAGGGSGAGASIAPVALIVIFKGIPGPEGLKVMTMEKPSAIAKVIGEALPIVMEKIGGVRKKKPEATEGE
jgi:uncharacterized spore protein YtfJ